MARRRRLPVQHGHGVEPAPGLSPVPESSNPVGTVGDALRGGGMLPMRPTMHGEADARAGWNPTVHPGYPIPTTRDRMPRVRALPPSGHEVPPLPPYRRHHYGPAPRRMDV